MPTGPRKPRSGGSLRSVDLIIATYDNVYWLTRCLNSIQYAGMPEVNKVIIVDNHGNMPPGPYRITPGKNLGWVGALVAGLKESDTEFVCFLNDDTEFERWPNNLSTLMQHFDDEKVAMVGPATSIALGAQSVQGPEIEEVKLLIGFCQIVRRSALEAIGGFDESFNLGGDDFDLCIRLRKAGYKLILDRRVFVYHHAFKTGQRLFGKSNIPGGWNSPEMATDVYERISAKHGSRALMELVEVPEYKQKEIPLVH